MIRKEQAKGDCIDNVWPFSLLNTNLKNLANMLAKWLVRITDGLDLGGTDLHRSREEPSGQFPSTLHL